MGTPSIENKTIRPGSLMGYSYYHSAPKGSPSVQPKVRRSRSHKKLALALIVLALATWGGLHYLNKPTPDKPAANLVTAPIRYKAPTQSPAPKPASGPCASNASGQLVLVSISNRHLWACQGTAVAYSSPVITGDTQYPDTTTPLGTYQIYGKETDITLTGSSSTGSWSDPVSYWMPFLDNQYGAYGLHDATWRPNSAFGNVDPSSANASHGCVELPLATAKWIYSWVQVGTSVTIES